MVCEAVGYEGETVWDASRPDGQPVRYLDVSRARELIGFEAEMPLAEGLRRTVEGFRPTKADGVFACGGVKAHDLRGGAWTDGRGGNGSAAVVSRMRFVARCGGV